MYGRFTEIELPFFSAAELEVMKVIIGVAVPRFWAAVCIWQETNQDGLMEFRFKKLDRLSLDEPIGPDLCQ